MTILLDTGPLDRFTERWRKQTTVNVAPTKTDIAALRRVMTAKYSLRCGVLYKHCNEHGTWMKCGEGVCQDIAKLHALGLLEVSDKGNIRPNDDGISILVKNDKLQSNED